MIDQGERKIVVVLSMHRCGSSLTTNVLHRLGMSLGPFEIYGAHSSNPHGHFKAIPFMSLNRRVQDLVYGFKEDIPDSPEHPGSVLRNKRRVGRTIHIPDDLVAEGRSLIRSLVDSGPISGFKDPRTVLTWPFWKRVLAHFPDVAVVPVVFTRSPHEIAMSIVTRCDGWCGYWTALDVIAVHLRRQLLILESWKYRLPTLCFGNPTFLKTLEIAVSECGLTWDTATVLDLFDRSCVHQSPAAVNHEAQGVFEALCGEDAAHPDPESSRIRQEKDARFLENLRLRRWASNPRPHLPCCRRRRYDAANRAAEVESRAVASPESAGRDADSTGRGPSVDSAPAAESERARQLIADPQARHLLIVAQDREIQAWQRNEQLRDRLERFDSHPILGPAIRGRRRIRRLIHSNATSPAVQRRRVSPMIRPLTRSSSSCSVVDRNLGHPVLGHPASPKCSPTIETIRRAARPSP